MSNLIDDTWTKSEIMEEEIYCDLVGLIPKQLIDGSWAWVANDIQGSFFKDGEEIEDSIELCVEASEKLKLLDIGPSCNLKK